MPTEPGLPRAARVVVVGGGIVGASVAFHLTRAGVEDVLVLERGELAGAASGKPIGGLRAQFSDPLNATLALRSLEGYAALAADMDHRRVGYLFLLRTPADVARFEPGIALQNELGIPSVMLEPAEARARCPAIDAHAFAGAAFCPIDGHARPRAAARAYVDDARRRGARLVTGCAVTGIDVVDGEIRAVHTTRGPVRTSIVVCAAGAWSRAIGAMAGVDLDVTPLRRQIAFTGPTPLAAPTLPFAIDFTSSFYFHAADDGLLLGMSDPAEATGFDAAYEPAWEPSLREAAAACAPALADLPITHGWAGLYEVTPDASALIGEARAPGRFLYATGFSGHGFCQAPAAGEIVADLVLGRRPFVDVSALRAERFAQRAPVAESNIV
jgi:glycine/D-amino acid oxidase-like deaminating enzyme